jgi:anthranilate phosphoribosyltransferase
MVFHSANGLDELVPGTDAAGIEVVGRQTRPWRLDAAGLALAPVALEQLAGGDAGENAAMLARLLEGEPGPRREAVLLNAGAALVVEGRAGSLAEGHALARASIDSGAAAGCFQRMKEASRGA